MRNVYFGAIRARLFVGGIFSVPISLVKCFKCPAASEYIAWVARMQLRADWRKASALFAVLVERDPRIAGPAPTPARRYGNSGSESGARPAPPSLNYHAVQNKAHMELP